MHWMDHRSCFSLKLLSMRMTVTPDTSYDIDFKFCEDWEFRCQVNVILMHLGVWPLLVKILGALDDRMKHCESTFSQEEIKLFKW